MASPKLPRHHATVIGFAHGTFDLLHDGHIYFLRRARRRCDELIVAIDSDRFACQRKGPGRPVEDEATRSHRVSASGLVSLVIAVDSDNQLSDAIDYYQPNILFAGDGFDMADLKHRIRPLAARADIFVIERLPGHSTTDAIKDSRQ